ncbi:uncharacterized protein B0H18DRAFT_950047 [Fomitopsis serialis]|uniref:uncharacterized protein n=1 Tax=Fomitopsis serialis TaxID=139415 RepID=UPI00200799C8|nr:uncharacterized protein B0H18DRAFT_950047 [Neoantrodia serialis]KAH9937066.1 hypothetical protein B0H18DRAFT_950047 [Neoantrodia serialis]
MVPPPKLKDAEYFSKTGGKGWYCKLCTPAERAEAESMTPLESCTSWDHYYRDDKMPDYIPFWRDGVMAAERGEQVGKMEDFLERLDHNIRKRVGLVDDEWGGDIGLNMWGGSPAPNAWGVQKQQKPPMRPKQWGANEANWDVPDIGEGWGQVDSWPLWTADDGWGVPADSDPWAAADEAGMGARATDWGVSTATESSRKDEPVQPTGRKAMSRTESCGRSRRRSRTRTR